MNLWRKLIHRTSALPFASARRFVAGGGVDTATASSRANRFIEQNSFKLLCASFLLIKFWKFKAESRVSVRDSITKSDDAFTRAMKDEGVTKEYCEAKVAQLKQKTQSLSATEHDRLVLQIYEEWLQVYKSVMLDCGFE